MTYRTAAEEAEARGEDHHEGERAGRPRRSNPWVDPIKERDQYLELLSEDIAGLRYELQEKEAEYERVSQWRPEPVPERVFDARGIKSAGADERAEWRDAS